MVPGYAYLRRNRFVMLGNPDLKPESSINYEASALWSNRRGLSAGATVFYNDFQDKLSTITTTERWNGYIRMDRVNIDKAVIRGVELNGSWEIDPALRVRANYTFTDSEQRSGANQGAPLSLTPRHKASLRADWTVSGRVDTWAALRFYGKEYGTTVSGRPAPSYTTADLGASYALTKQVTLNAALNNLTDKRLNAVDFGTVNYGRNLWVSANISF